MEPHERHGSLASASTSELRCSRTRWLPGREQVPEPKAASAQVEQARDQTRSACAPERTTPAIRIGSRRFNGFRSSSISHLGMARRVVIALLSPPTPSRFPIPGNESTNIGRRASRVRVDGPLVRARGLTCGSDPGLPRAQPPANVYLVVATSPSVER